MVVQLADQGPVLPGRPTLKPFSEMRRDDGTALEPTVPAPTTTTIPVITPDMLAADSAARND